MTASSRQVASPPSPALQGFVAELRKLPSATKPVLSVPDQVRLLFSPVYTEISAQMQRASVDSVLDLMVEHARSHGITVAKLTLHRILRADGVGRQRISIAGLLARERDAILDRLKNGESLDDLARFYGKELKRPIPRVRAALSKLFKNGNDRLPSPATVRTTLDRADIDPLDTI